MRELGTKDSTDLALGWSPHQESAGFPHAASQRLLFVKNEDGKKFFFTLWVAAYFKGHQSKQKEKTVNLCKSKK